MKTHFNKYLNIFVQNVKEDTISKWLFGLIVIMLFVIGGSFDDYDNYGNLIEGNHCPIGISLSIITTAIIGIFLRKNK